MDVDRLRVFVAVAEARSFTAAASRLRMPKSSVSREISRLEADTGVRLLHRTTRQVTPTSAGQALLERVGPLLAGLEQAVTEARQQVEPAGLLRVTAPVDLGAALLAGIVARFVARYPDVRVEARLTNQVVDLVAEGIDVALRVSTDQLRDSSLTARRLGNLALDLFASPRYLARRGTPRAVEDLAEHDVVAFPGDERARIVADDMFFVREALRGGAGIGLLPSFLAEEDLESGALVRVLPELSRRTGTVWFVTPHAAHPPRAVVAFRDLLADALKRRPLQ
jgi:DNA-binding transcriptional LysR family regulator